MRCPIDEAELVMTERQGVEIDYCPTCRGVWLDRGELDKILDRAADLAAPAAPAGPGAPPPSSGDREGYRGGERDGYRAGPPRGDGYRGEGYRGDAYRGDAYRGDAYRGDSNRGDSYRGDSHRGDSRPPHRKKKESWLGEIFDFG